MIVREAMESNKSSIMKRNAEISTLSEYLRWVKSKQIIQCKVKGFAKPISTDIRKNLYFRGQSNKKWMITFALYRYRFESEYKWLKAAELRTWQETSHLSNLNKLIVFQHYGLNTRLLDVTRNPLVALYFACLPSSKKETCGAVYYGFKNEYNSLLSECLADILFSLEYEPCVAASKKDIEEKIKERNVVSKENLPYLRDILCIPHFIEAPMNNPRISVQQGAFIMAPLLTEHKGEKGVSYCAHRQYRFKQGDQQEEDVFFKEDRAIIPASKKKDMLMELDDIGINSCTLFRDMEHTLMAVNQEKITGQWE